MFTPNKFKTSEYQKYLNAYEIFSKEEIKTLKKLNPDINNLFKVSSQINNYNNKDSYLKTDNSKETYKKFISKKIFFSLILEEIKKYFENKKDPIMTKAISLLINEIITMSKIVQENQILTEFFDKIRKDRTTCFEDGKKLFNNDKNLKMKKDLNSKSEKHFERYISNGGNVLKNSQNKAIKIIKNTSFSDLNNFEKGRDKIIRNMHTENGIIPFKKNNDLSTFLN